MQTKSVSIEATNFGVMSVDPASALAPGHREFHLLLAVWGLLLRDILVLRREFGSFLLRTVMNPLMFVFVFTYVFPKIGQGFSGSDSFATVVFPGLLAVAVVFQGIAAIALPLSVELGATREIEDRIMTPVPVHVVAITKVVFSAFQSILAALAVWPVAYFLPSGRVAVHVSNWPLLLGVLVLGGLAAGSLGLMIGTMVKPKQISLMFSVIVIPITFLGCVYYPWALLDRIPWLKIAVLLNPLVYISEGLRAALTPDVPHMSVLWILAALMIAIAVMATLGVRRFVERLIR